MSYLQGLIQSQYERAADTPNLSLLSNSSTPGDSPHPNVVAGNCDKWVSFRMPCKGDCGEVFVAPLATALPAVVVLSILCLMQRGLQLEL